MLNFKYFPVIAGIIMFLSINISPVMAQTYSGIDYGKTGNAYQKLDIYMPTAGTKPYAVVVWIHGGRFSAGSRTEANAAQLAGLIGPRGAAVVSIDYRLSGTAIWPAQIQDCKAAVRWIRANAATYNFDPNRIGVAGGSAGGHLSEFVGVTGDIGTATSGAITMDLEGTVGGTSGYSSKVQAVAPMYGLSDFLTLNDTCPQNNPKISTLTTMRPTVRNRRSSAGRFRAIKTSARLQARSTSSAPTIRRFAFCMATAMNLFPSARALPSPRRCERHSRRIKKSASLFNTQRLVTGSMFPPAAIPSASFLPGA
jgi:acetyl esterase/lipase